MRVELLAYPARHSVSPAMHNAAFAHLGVDAHYVAREVPPAELARAVAGLRRDDVLGANVTIPHKEAIIPLLDEVSLEAREVGAVNTVVRRGESLIGHNTDAAGFMRSVLDLSFEPHGRSVLLLGAGGAARAVAYALLSAEVARLAIWNRNASRARSLAGDLARHGRIVVIPDGQLAEEVSAADMLVNATPVGMAVAGPAAATPLPPGVLPRHGIVVDLVYRPLRTRLLEDAEGAGLRVQNGLPMLVYQGADSFALWTGRDAPVEVMAEAARGALGT